MFSTQLIVTILLNICLEQFNGADAPTKILSPNIRVNTICPGIVDTTWRLNYFDSESYNEFKKK